MIKIDTINISNNVIFFKNNKKSFMYFKHRIINPSIKIKNKYIFFNCRRNTKTFYINKTKNNIKYIKTVLGVKNGKK